VIFNTRVSTVSSPCSSEDSDSSPSSTSSFCERPSVHLSDGTVLEADIIVGADGQHSTVRLSVEEKQVKPKSTGTLVLTGNVPMEKILEDDILKAESMAYSWVYWFGPHRCFMGESSLLIERHLSLTTFQAIRL
jgi:2-polyprenyl-6-methoxyphenol hydroxylase-like FAD-dependent oxidoreductase